ncbi:hypothetical protein EII29_09755 [Leptotrichia sp. OH3620_COT-345]|uniref:hypothetical protein n=1 Tax=Leptotrichia sp. OH3620_COT-345 TaxID=2491048 RepID=UPI000F649F70|nr:hypothetical protein [Leptotrichia sp. OH3620_COT-345]RRD38800.1 hypothetical protein EII29_09755 [Leptotrichia sp. OH3620_COT-345]
MKVAITHLDGNVTEIYATQYKVLENDFLVNMQIYKKEEVLKIKINGMTTFERIVDEKIKYSKIEDFSEFVGKDVKEKDLYIREIKGFGFDSRYIFPYFVTLYDASRDFKFEERFRTLKNLKKFLDENLIKEWKN